MHIVHVQVQVAADQVEAFVRATLRNAAQSRLEPGVARFDVIQQEDEPTRFVLVEVYRTPDDAARHKQTAHYAEWRDAVASMMAAARVGTKFRNLDPGDEAWGSRPTT